MMSAIKPVNNHWYLMDKEKKHLADSDYQTILDGLEISIYVIEEATVAAESALTPDDRKMSFKKMEEVMAVRDLVREIKNSGSANVPVAVK